MFSPSRSIARPASQTSQQFVLGRGGDTSNSLVRDERRRPEPFVQLRFR
jgi:hypothetical protein